MAKATSPPEFNQSITDAFKIELKHAGYKLEESGAARYKMMGKVITYSSKYGFLLQIKLKLKFLCMIAQFFFLRRFIVTKHLNFWVMMIACL